MKRIIVCSVFDAFEYVMDHYYPYGMEDVCAKNDCYAVISIQDSHTKGFGVQFQKNVFCKDVLTLLFDDIVTEVEGAVLFQDAMADRILDFADANQEVDTLLVHCYAGQSRSKAVGKFLYDVYHKKYPSLVLETAETGVPNEYVYDVLDAALLIRRLQMLGM